MVIRDGVVLGMEAGVMPGEAIDDVIRQVKSLDMDEVRKNLVDEQPAPTYRGAVARSIVNNAA